MSEERRTAWRRRLLLAGLVPLLLALLLALKVGVMLQADSSGRSSYASGDFERSRSAFERNLVANVLEPWVADYDHGTAQYRLGDFEGSVESLRSALDTVPAEHECRVRINLALAHERLGDELVANDREAALEEWRRGTTALQDGGCLGVPLASKGERDDPDAEDDQPDSSGGAEPRDEADASDMDADSEDSQDPGDVNDGAQGRSDADRDSTLRDARTVADRLGDKAEEADRPPDTDDPRADELDRRNDLGERQRREQEQRRRDQEDRREQDEPDDTDVPPNYDW